jgi:hypothetical protein
LASWLGVHYSIYLNQRMDLAGSNAAPSILKLYCANGYLQRLKSCDAEDE